VILFLIYDIENVHSLFDVQKYLLFDIGLFLDDKTVLFRPDVQLNEMKRKRKIWRVHRDTIDREINIMSFFFSLSHSLCIIIISSISSKWSTYNKCLDWYLFLLIEIHRKVFIYPIHLHMDLMNLLQHDRHQLVQ